jgi:probable metal-binding protein
MFSMKQVHGHEILRLLHDANPPLTRSELAQEVQRRFGANARFCTCSADSMTLDELIAFLAARGKLVEHEGCLIADISQMCADGGQRALRSPGLEPSQGEEP